MPTNKQTISVRLDETAKMRVEKAAKLVKQSSGAFVGKAGEERALRVLRDYAVSRHKRGEASLSELAAETGLAVEEIVESLMSQEADTAFEMFITSCRTVAEIQNNPDFLRLGEEAVEALKSRRIQNE